MTAVVVCGYTGGTAADALCVYKARDPWVKSKTTFFQLQSYLAVWCCQMHLWFSGIVFSLTNSHDLVLAAVGAWTLLCIPEVDLRWPCRCQGGLVGPVVGTALSGEPKHSDSAQGPIKQWLCPCPASHKPATSVCKSPGDGNHQVFFSFLGS